MMRNNIILFFVFCVLQLLFSCRAKNTSVEDQAPVVSVKTALVRKGDIETSIRLNGKTIYLKKNIVVSPISGYIFRMNIRFGEVVRKDDILFEIQSKEMRALENSNGFSENTGVVKVPSPASGIISELNINETGGYIVEGGALCTVVESGDLVIQMNVPFRYNDLLKKDVKCRLILPDNSVMEGYIYKILPLVDVASQTQTVLIKPSAGRNLPENLNLIIQITDKKRNNILLAAKNSVMTNETQTEFWVMKLTRGNLAVKVPIIKGIENDSIVEISSPLIKVNDNLISEGAYSLDDSTIVKIEK